MDLVGLEPTTGRL